MGRAGSTGDTIPCRPVSGSKDGRAPHLDQTVLDELQSRKIQITRVQKLGGGRNSRVLLLESPDQSMVLKSYPQFGDDQRDRMGTEVKVLGFLHRHGVRQVPEPLFWCKEKNWAAFSLLKGRTIKEITPALLEGVAQFLGRLKAAGDNSREAQALPLASEACFSMEALQEMLTGRLKRLEAMRGRGSVQNKAYQWCSQWLEHDHQRLMQQLKMRNQVDQIGAEITRQERILSPSDVGIHNMLQMEDGLGFLDFEYAGWDDPAKFTADWILQPDNPLLLDQALQLVGALSRQIGEGSWQERLTTLMEFNRLKWCAIMLNMFIREQGETAQDALSRQLDRTQAYFQDSMALVSGFREVY